MITNEQHEKFFKEIDDLIGSFKTVCNTILDDGLVEFALERYTKIRFGRQLPIKWVKQGDTEVKEFYTAELNLPWLVTYINYYNEFLDNDSDLELLDIKHSCLFLGLALSKVRGINIVNDTVYVLKNDIEFVNYKLDKQIFI
jgi:hypothetical protein